MNILKQMDSETAYKFQQTMIYANWSYELKAAFQLYHEYLCIPFNEFHEAIEKTLGRPIFIHEFGFTWEELKKEFCQKVGTDTILDFLKIHIKE